MSNPCYHHQAAGHQAAGGLNTAQMVLRCITISNKSGSIYKDESASTFWFTPSQQANHNWIPFIWAKPRIRVIINLGGSYWPAPSFPDPTRNSVGYVCILCCSSISPPHVHLPFLLTHWSTWQWNILLSISLPKIGISSCHVSVLYMR